LPTYADACRENKWTDAFAWTSSDAASSACLLGVTQGDFKGHEVFNIVAPEVCWEGGLTPELQSRIELEEKEGALKLLESMWGGRVEEGNLNREWWSGNPRRSTWDSTKAERLLGWDHDASSER